MTERYLVAYASGSGSTAEVAAAIQEEMQQAGLTVDLRAAADVSDLRQYSGVVVGSSIRVGRWLPEAVEFVRVQQAALAQLPVAYFTTCLTLIDDNFANRQTVIRYLAPVINLAPAVHPLGLGLFAGSLQPALGQLMSEQTIYGDYRDWQQIRAWGRAIGNEMRRSAGNSGMAGPVAGRAAADDRPGIIAAAGPVRVLDAADNSIPPGRELGWADLQGADLLQADLRKANLIGADCRRADLRAAILTFSVLNGAVLRGADLRGADLSGADLNWADLTDARCAGILLRGANACWANFTRCDFTGAEFEGMLYNAQTKWPADFSPPETAVLVAGPG